MFKTFLKLVAIGVVLISAAGLFLVYSYKSRMENYIQQQIVQGARGSNINLAFEEFKINLLGAKARALSLFFPKTLLSFTVQEPEVSLPFMPLLALSPEIRIRGSLFDSRIDGSAAYDLRAETAAGKLLIPNLDLSKVPQLSLLGISKGTFNLEIKQFNLRADGFQGLQGTYNINGLRTAKANSFPLKINNSHEQITIPPIDNLDLAAFFIFKDERFELNQGVVKSDLGDAAYQAEISFGQANNAERVRIDLKADLTQKGLDYFGFLLPKISNNLISETQNSFKMVAEGTPRNMKFSFTPLNN